MEDQNVQGILSLSLGETQLTLWEAAKLKPGDIVLSGREAGYPHFLLFNHLPIGLGEVVILGRVLGIKVVDTDYRPVFHAEPGRVEELVESLPTVIELGEVKLGLDQLPGLGKNSFINLGLVFETPTEALLVVAGVKWALGQVVVVGEMMGLRITRRLVKIPAPERVLQSGNLADRAVTVKDYQFNMPDRFTRVHVRRLGEIHDLLRRNLEFSLPELHLAARSSFVDQCTLSEAIAGFAKWGLSVAQTLEHRGRGRKAMSQRTLLFEADDCQLPVDDATRTYLHNLVSEGGGWDHQVFVYTRPGLHAEAAILEGLRNGWKRYMDFALAPAETVVMPGYEMVIIATLFEEGNESPVLGIAYPYATLEPYLNLLGS